MQNAPIKLNRASLALNMTKDDLLKVSGYLPTPSHTIVYHGLHTQNVTIVYELDKPITSAKQFIWFSEIKRTWKKYIITPFEFVDEVYIDAYTQSTGAIYSLHELSKRFKIEFVRYPKIYYPLNKQEFYLKLVWHAIKLHRKAILERDLMVAVALIMNEKLTLKDQYSYRDLLKKASSAFYYIKENAKPKLTKKELNLKLIEGGKIRGAQRKDEYAQNIQKVKEALSLHVKPNGKVNVTTLANATNLSRPTVTKIVKSLLLLCFFGFILMECMRSSAIIPIAYFTLLQEAHLYGVFERSNRTNTFQSSYFRYTDSLLYTFAETNTFCHTNHKIVSLTPISAKKEDKTHCF